MFKIMKMSKYNFNTYNHEGDLIVYNFLTGIPSLTKVKKSDVDKFTELFLMDSEIHGASCKGHSEAVESMLKSGILVAGDTDESVLYDSKHYDEVYDRKLVLTILPTGKCNFSCPYCYEASQNFHREAMSIDNQNALIKFVQKNIHNYNGMRVIWFGGEPLLEPETIKYLSSNFIQACNARFLPYSAEMITNGYFLNADMFDMLYKLKIYAYMITIDGFKEQHDKLRFLRDGMGSYDVIMGNLLRIRDNKQYKFAHILIRINVSEGFFDKFDDFVSFIAESFSDDPRFEFQFEAVSLGPKATNIDIFIHPNVLSSHLLKNEVYTSKLVNDNDKSKFISIISANKCLAAKKNTYVITSDLSLYKCNYQIEGIDNKIGCINLKGDLLVNETLHKRWYLINKFVRKIPKSCDNCFYFPCCRYGNPSCPIQYHVKQLETSCHMKDEKFLQNLNETVLHAAHKYSCTMLSL